MTKTAYVIIGTSTEGECHVDIFSDPDPCVGLRWSTRIVAQFFADTFVEALTAAEGWLACNEVYGRLYTPRSAANPAETDAARRTREAAVALTVSLGGPRAGVLKALDRLHDAVRESWGGGACGCGDGPHSCHKARLLRRTDRQWHLDRRKGREFRYVERKRCVRDGFRSCVWCRFRSDCARCYACGAKVCSDCVAIGSDGLEACPSCAALTPRG